MSEFTVSRDFHSDRRSPVRWITSHLRRQKWLILAMMLGALGNASLAAAVPVLVGRAFDAAVAEPPNVGLIGWMALAIVVSQAVRAGLQLGRNFSSEVIGLRLERDTREELYLSLLGKSMTFHDLRPVGDTMARVTNDVRQIYRLMNPGVNLVIGSANFILLPLIVAPTYRPQLVAAPAFFLVTYVLALARYLGVLRPVADRVRRSFGDLNSRLAEAIDGIETVKGAA
ncbi:MAG: ABC transporter ATP-binding protein, partial [Candidatus Promineifilaceae bacterium]|nr:ABC transporter ATP-binding protein [Candidatus Promineifilaceae bacterium]